MDGSDARNEYAARDGADAAARLRLRRAPRFSRAFCPFGVRTFASRAGCSPDRMDDARTNSAPPSPISPGAPSSRSTGPHCPTQSDAANRIATRRSAIRASACLLRRSALRRSSVLDRSGAAGRRRVRPAGYRAIACAPASRQARRAGVSTFKIRQQTGHASDAMLSRYVRDGELFLGNAAGVLL